MITLAIIGGGPAAVSLCMQFNRLLQQNGLNQPIQILVFEKNDTIGRGTPYRSEHSCLLINLAKEMMDLSPNDAMRFSHWLNLREEKFLNEPFVPRHYFGQYVESMAIDTQLESKKSGLTIKYLTQSDVLGVHASDNGQYKIILSQASYLVDYVILGIGHLPSSNFRHLLGTPGYVHHPWEETWDVDPNASVGILGSRLTAIDVALKLKAASHKGCVHMLSRSGKLPVVRGKEAFYIPKYLTLERVQSLTKHWTLPLKLTDLLRLFWQEINEVTLTKKYVTPASPEDWLNNEITQAEGEPRDWQKVMSLAYQFISKLWPKLNARDKAIFYKKYYSFFAVFTCAFPLENAYQIKSMLDTQQLNLCSGLLDVRHQEGQFILNFKQERIIKTEYVINASGSGGDSDQVPFLKQMVHDNLLIKNALGGISVTTETLNTLNGHGKINKKMYALGDLVRGSCFYTIEINHVVQQANKISRHLLNEILLQH